MSGPEVTDFNQPNLGDASEPALPEPVENKDDKKASNINDLVKFPIARIKRIMKTDPELKLMSKESVLLVTKATELMLERLTREATKNAVEDSRRTIQYKDVAKAVHETESFEFLSDVVPRVGNKSQSAYQFFSK